MCGVWWIMNHRNICPWKKQHTSNSSCTTPSALRNFAWLANTSAILAPNGSLVSFFFFSSTCLISSWIFFFGSSIRLSTSASQIVLVNLFHVGQKATQTELTLVSSYRYRTYSCTVHVLTVSTRRLDWLFLVVTSVCLTPRQRCGNGTGTVGGTVTFWQVEPEP